MALPNLALSAGPSGAYGGPVQTGGNRAIVGGNPNVSAALSNPWLIGGAVLALIVWTKFGRK